MRRPSAWKMTEKKQRKGGEKIHKCDAMKNTRKKGKKEAIVKKLPRPQTKNTRTKRKNNDMKEIKTTEKLRKCKATKNNGKKGNY